MKVPIYGEPQVALGGRPRQGLSGQEIQQIGWWGGGQMARQGQDMMQAAHEMMGIEIQRQRDDAAIEFEKKRGAFEVAWATAHTQTQQEDAANVSKYNDIGYGGEASKDSNTFYNKSVARFNKLLEDPQYKSNNQFFNQAWAKWSAAKLADIKVEAIKFEAAQRVQARENSIDDAITNDARLAAADPARVPELVEKWKGILSNTGNGKDANGDPLPNYSQVVRSSFLRDRHGKVGSVIAGPALEKMIMDDPKSAWVILNKMQQDLKTPSKVDQGADITPAKRVENYVKTAEDMNGETLSVGGQEFRTGKMVDGSTYYVAGDKTVSKENFTKFMELAVQAEPPQKPGKPTPQKSLMERWGLEADEFVKLYHKAKSAVEAVSVYDEYKLRSAVENHIAAVSNGGAGDPQFKTKDGLAAAVSKVYDPFNTGNGKLNERAMVFVDEAWKKIQTGQKAFNIVSSLKFADAATINATLNRLQPSGANAAETEQIRNHVIGAVNSMISQRNTDPVGYANSHPQVQKLLKDGDVAGARTMSIALQMKMGTPDYDIGVLSKDEAAAEINRFRKADKNQAITFVRDFETRFGGRNEDGTIKYPGQLAAAWRQLTTGPNALDPSWQFASRAMGTSAETLVFHALRADQKDLKANLGSLTKNGVSYADIESTVINETAELKRALTGNLPGRMDVYTGARELVTKMAALDVYENGADPTKASRKAVKTLTDSFDLTGGTYFIPKNRPGYPNAYNLQNIHTNADYLKSAEGLTSYFSIVPPGSKDPVINTMTDFRQSSYGKTIVSQGYWITSDDSSGLMLVVNNGLGAEPVMTKNGPLVVKFKELSRPNADWNKKSGAAPMVLDPLNGLFMSP
jgi:hypothetical protein